MSELKTLSDIEKEMLLVLNDGKSYWTKCYRLMRIVEKEQLYLEANYRSFTAWLNAFQFKAGVNIRILWQQKKAGSFYESYRRKNKEKIKDLPDIDTVRITPTNLNYIEKISESHPWLEDKLMKKAIEGNVTRRELQNTWESIKAERIAKGEMVARVTRHDKEMITATVEQRLSATKALLTIQSDYKWLSKGKKAASDKKYQIYANYEQRYDNKSFFWDILIAETITSNSNNIILHGLILLKEDQSIDCEVVNAFKDFVDRTWFIVPNEESIPEEIAENFGIISLDTSADKNKVRVIKYPPKGNGEKRDITIVSLLMKYLKNVDCQSF